MFFSVISTIIAIATPSAHAQSFELELKRVASIRAAFGDSMVQDMTNLPPTHYKRARERVLALSKRVLDGEIQASEAAAFLHANFLYINNHIGDLLGEGAAQCLLKEPIQLLRTEMFEPITASAGTKNPDNAPAVCKKIQFQCDAGTQKVDAFAQHIVQVCGGKPSADVEIPSIAITEPPRKSAPAPVAADDPVVSEQPVAEEAPAPADGKEKYTFGGDSLSESSGPIMETPAHETKADSMPVDQAKDADVMSDAPTLGQDTEQYANPEPAAAVEPVRATKPGKRRIGEPELEAE